MLKRSSKKCILFFLAFVVFIALSVNTSYADKAIVVLYKTGCDYFISDGPRGYYLLEWYGGYDPTEGDVIIGDIASYGFKDVYYPRRDREGRIYVEDYLLSKEDALEEYVDHCN